MRSIFIIILLIVSSCASNKSPAERYAKKVENPSYSYEWWKKDQTSVWQKVFGKDPSVKRANNYVRSHERMVKRAEAEKELKEKVKSIKSKVNNQ